MTRRATALAVVGRMWPGGPYTCTLAVDVIHSCVCVCVCVCMCVLSGSGIRGKYVTEAVAGSDQHRVWISRTVEDTLRPSVPRHRRWFQRGRLSTTHVVALSYGVCLICVGLWCLSCIVTHYICWQNTLFQTLFPYDWFIFLMYFCVICTRDPGLLPTKIYISYWWYQEKLWCPVPYEVVSAPLHRRNATVVIFVIVVVVEKVQPYSYLWAFIQFSA